MKVCIDKFEDYPVYGIEDEDLLDDESTWDIPEEKISWIHKANMEYGKTQEYLEKLYEDKKEKHD